MQGDSIFPLYSKPDLIVVRPEDLYATSGPSKLIQANGSVTWYFDSTTNESVNGAIYPFPPDWSTFDVDFWWSGTTGAAGDVVWRFEYAAKGPGDTLGTLSAVQASAVASAGSGVVVSTTVATSIACPASGKAMTFQVARRADAAGDTLAVDAAVFLVVFRKAS